MSKFKSRKRGRLAPIAILTIDKYNIFEAKGYLEEYKVIEVAVDGNKFIYYIKSNI